MNKLLSIAFALFISLHMNSQLRQNSVPNFNVMSNSSAFLDASSSTSFNSTTNIAKGLVFPRVDLSTFTFSNPGSVGIPNNFPTYYDGMIVYNTAETGVAGIGKTEGTLSPGFWYYDNKTQKINTGTWKSLSSGSGNANPLDVGYIVAWTALNDVPGYLIPLSGGKFDKADYPELMEMHKAFPNKLIVAEDATSFTVANLNDQRTLRGNTVPGLMGGSNTKMIQRDNLPKFTLGGTTNSVSAGTPSGNVSISNTTATMQNAGAHQHTGASSLSGPNSFSGGPYGNNIGGVMTGWAGDHAHTINPHSHAATFAGNALAGHGHTITTEDLNNAASQAALDVQNAYVDVIFCLKAKPLASSGNISINNNVYNVSPENGLYASSGKAKLGGTLTEPTRIAASSTNNLMVTGNELDIFNAGQNALSVDGRNSRIGIGTTSPVTKLDVEGNVRAKTENMVQAVSGSSPTGYATHTIRNIAGNTIFKIQSEWGADDDKIFFVTDDDNSGATESIRLAISRSNGNLGIGITNPLSRLHVNGEIRSGESGVGYVTLGTGNANNSGHINFFRPNGTRNGYIGWGATNIDYMAENGGRHYFGGGRVMVSTLAGSGTAPVSATADGTLVRGYQSGEVVNVQIIDQAFFSGIRMQGSNRHLITKTYVPKSPNSKIIVEFYNNNNRVTGWFSGGDAADVFESRLYINGSRRNTNNWRSHFWEWQTDSRIKGQGRSSDLFPLVGSMDVSGTNPVTIEIELLRTEGDDWIWVENGTNVLKVTEIAR